MKDPFDYILAFVFLVALFFGGAATYAQMQKNQCDRFGMTNFGGDVYVCHLKIDGP